MNVIDLHKEIWEQLGARRKNLPHALLLCGQRGIGKFALAFAFAKAMLCETPSAHFSACETCPACTWLSQGNHPDFRLLQPEILNEDTSASPETENKKKPSQQITIDQIRALDDFLHVGTHRHGIRIVLINPAEAMNRSTANALLKSLEEPSDNTLFILVSSETERLLPTIRSRCQSLSIPLPDQHRAKDWLTRAGMSDGGHWLALSGGSPLLALDLGQSGENELLEALIAEMAQGGAIDPVKAATKMERVIKTAKGQAPLRRTFEWAQKWICDLSLAAEKLPLRYFLSHEQLLHRLSGSTDTGNLLALNRKTIQYRLQSEHPLNSRLFLEDFFQTYAAAFQNLRGNHG